MQVTGGLVLPVLGIITESEGGAYILGTADGTLLTYPWATSPVFYIGSATYLVRRLAEHAKFVRAARQDHTAGWWWPR